jgi:DNA helicase-2/ATP-dependent DNA helicase PcrA
MRDFEREYAGANVIRLEQNYRSHGNILAAANALIKNNRERLGKNLWTDAGERRADPRLRGLFRPRRGALHRRRDPRTGARRRAPTQIALLYRSNAQSRVLEHELFAKGVPYKVYGGLRFFERQEIKHALAYLRLIGNPDDDTAFPARRQFPDPRHRRPFAGKPAGQAHQMPIPASTTRPPR